jgi:hypothetical protein
VNAESIKLLTVMAIPLIHHEQNVTLRNVHNQSQSNLDELGDAWQLSTVANNNQKDADAMVSVMIAIIVCKRLIIKTDLGNDGIGDTAIIVRLNQTKIRLTRIKVER